MRVRAFIIILLFSATFASAQQSKKLHFKSVLVDGHNDVLSSAPLEGVDISNRVRQGHSDLVRWKEGGVDVQFFSVWTGDKPRTTKGFYNDAVEEIQLLDELVRKNPGRMVLARTYKDVEKGIKQKKLVSLIGVEGGHMIEDDMKKLEELYKMGMRYMTLTWNNNTSWATSALHESGAKSYASIGGVASGIEAPVVSFRGLNPFGKDLVRKMNELGIIVDLSHTGEQTFSDAISTSTKPVMLSHSSVYNICPVFRNVKDEQLRALAKNGGVICINFYSGFISKKWDETQKYLLANKNSIIGSKWNDLDSTLQKKAWKTYYDSTLDTNRPTLSEVVDHIDYVVKLIGDDYVGIGSDFDGIDSWPVGLDDVTTYPKITEELLRRGYSKSSIKKILGENVLRVMKANFQ